jgi:hypothetical protein
MLLAPSARKNLPICAGSAYLDSSEGIFGGAPKKIANPPPVKPEDAGSVAH